MITVTQVQQEAVAAELKRRKPRAPSAENIRQSKDVLRQGYSAPLRDRLDALANLAAAGIDHRPFDGAREDDGGPDGFHQVAEDHREAAGEERERQLARKTYADRGAHLAPATGTDPGKPRPENFDRPYIGEGHGAESPQSDLPRTNPKPAQEPGKVQPVAMPGAPFPVAHVVLPSNAVAATVPQHITASLSMGSPSDR